MSGWTTPRRDVSMEECRTPSSYHDGMCDEESCSVCYSPMMEKMLCVEEGRNACTLPCSHRFHLRCLQRTREFNIEQCPLCRALIPAGFTPQVVKERKRKQMMESAARMRDVTNLWTSREAMVGRATAAREAVRLATARRLREQEEQEIRMMQRQTASLTIRQSPFEVADDVTDDAMEEAVSARHDFHERGPCCSHCEDPICEFESGALCWTCYVCMQPFCSRCSTLDYRMRQDRAICLDCLPRHRT